jgi:cell division transport system permease protein
MVLVLLGLVVFSVLTAHNLSKYFRENFMVTAVVNDTLTVNDGHLLVRDIYHRPYAKQIDYISKEQANREQSKALGSDPSEFIGFNPFPATIEMQLKADYANKDSLKWISKELKANPAITDVDYQVDLMDKVNSNLRKFSLILLVLALLLTFISFALINNTVRLGIYSRRFLIHTMKLVGASWGFIRWPFVRRALIVGVVAAFLACCFLSVGFYGLYVQNPGILTLVSWVELAIVGVAVFVFGIVITTLSSYLSVGKFLRMRAGDLYKI